MLRIRRPSPLGEPAMGSRVRPATSGAEQQTPPGKTGRLRLGLLLPTVRFFFVCFLNAVTFRVGRSLHATWSLGIRCLCLGDSEGPGWTEGAGGRMGAGGGREARSGVSRQGRGPGGCTETVKQNAASAPPPPIPEVTRPLPVRPRGWRAAGGGAGWGAGQRKPGPGAGVGRSGRRGRGAPAPGSDAAARAVGAGREGAAAGFLRLPSGGGAEKPPREPSAPQVRVSAMSVARRRPPTLAPGPDRGRARGSVGARTLRGAGGPRPAHLEPTSPRPQHLGPPHLPRARPPPAAPWGPQVHPGFLFRASGGEELWVGGKGGLHLG